MDGMSMSNCPYLTRNCDQCAFIRACVVHVHVLYCHQRVTVMSYFVYKVMRDLESIALLWSNPIHRIGLLHK